MKKHTKTNLRSLILPVLLTGALLVLSACGKTASAPEKETAAAGENVAADENETADAGKTGADDGNETAAANDTTVSSPAGDASSLTGKVVIYTPTEDYLIEYLQSRLDEAFPQMDIVIDYYHSADLAARLKAEGTDTECDIVFDCEYGYLQLLSPNMAKLDYIDMNQFVDDMKDPGGTIFPVDRYSGSVVVNTKVLNDLSLPLPESYADLLKPEYKGLVEMPGPNLSSTGYLFLKSLVNAWGEEEAFAYFEKLDENILQYVAGGSTPIKDLVTGEAAIGLGLTFKAVDLIAEGAPLQILFFEEGAPYTPAGLSVVLGKESKPEVRAVVEYFYSDILDDYLNLYLPEIIKVGQENTVPGYPADIPYSDMSNNTPDVKESLLSRWTLS